MTRVRRRINGLDVKKANRRGFTIGKVYGKVFFVWFEERNLAVDWRELAFESYREARLVLDYWKGRQPPANLDYYVEEMKEALLDLKQATIDDDGPRAMEGILEVRTLMAELQDRSGDG
jgi:hypothetical protein